MTAFWVPHTLGLQNELGEAIYIETANVVTAEDAVGSARLLSFFKSGQACPAEPLSTEQNGVLQLLFLMIHGGPEASSIRVAELTDQVNQYFKDKGFRLCLQARKVGAVLTGLGFTRRTLTNTGWVMQSTQEVSKRIDQLAVSYGINGLQETNLNLARCLCPFLPGAPVSSAWRTRTQTILTSRTRSK